MRRIKKYKYTYRYLLYFAAVTAKIVIQILPRKLALSLGRAGGAVTWRMLSRERKKTLRHLEMVFENAVARYKIGKRLFQNLGMNLVEWFQMPRLNRKKINSIVRITGREKIDQVLRWGKGGIILTGHFGNWEYLAAYFLWNGYGGAVLARKIYFAPLNRLMLSLRGVSGVGTIWRDGSVRSMIKVLKKNNLLGILPDQNTDKVDGVYINFLGRQAYTPTGPVSLALATGAAIIPCFIVREGGYHHIYVEQPINMIEGKDKEETIRLNTESWSAVMEKYIRKYPDQWVWMHKRWRTAKKAGVVH